MESDEELLVRSASEPEAFEPLVERLGPALFAYVARRVSGSAEDVLSDVWLSACAGRATFDPVKGPARGWLFGIARNAIVSHHRRADPVLIAYTTGDEHEWDAVDERLDASRKAPALIAAIQALPEVERELLLMIALDGLTPTEAGAALAIPAGTARSRLHRARLRIREQLDADVPPARNPTPHTHDHEGAVS